MVDYSYKRGVRRVNWVELLQRIVTQQQWELDWRHTWYFTYCYTVDDRSSNTVICTHILHILFLVLFSSYSAAGEMVRMVPPLPLLLLLPPKTIRSKYTTTTRRKRGGDEERVIWRRRWKSRSSSHRKKKNPICFYLHRAFVLAFAASPWS